MKCKDCACYKDSLACLGAIEQLPELPEVSE